MEIRRATIDDVDLLTDLRLAFVADVRGLELAEVRTELAAATEAFLFRCLGDETLHAWLAFDASGAAVGTVALLLRVVPPRPGERHAHEGYVINMYVTPAARGQGAARALLEACLASAAELDIGRFALHATDAGRPLYESVGFTDPGRWLERAAGAVGGD